MIDDSKRRKVDRWATYNYFHDKVVRDFKLKPIDIAVWHALFRHGDQWGIIKLSKKRLRDESGITDKRTLNRSLERLCALKLIGVVQKGGWSIEKGRTCTVWWHRAKKLPGD